MITQLIPISELKQIWIELLLNKTDEVSDVGEDSVLNAIAFGCSKVGQKAIKDIAIVESQIFPWYAKGNYLDSAADLFGVSERRSALGSSTYIKLIAEVGTQYLQSTHTFKNNNGITFELEEDFTIGDDGYGYARIRSTGTGNKTNVDANSIITVTPEPAGHISCSNEYKATWGIDSESDEVFRERISNNNNLQAKTTLAYYNQIFRSLDDRILRAFNAGKDEDGKSILSLVTQNGVSFTQNELDELLEQLEPFLPLTEINKFNGVSNVIIQNIDWIEVDVDFRININASFNTDEVRKNIQINLTKVLDFRFWQEGNGVEWDDLLEAVKNTDGVNYVQDEYFTPSSDISVPIGKLPRIKGFIMRDNRGTIIYDNGGSLSPIFLPK